MNEQKELRYRRATEAARLRNEEDKLKVAYGTSHADGVPLPPIDGSDGHIDQLANLGLDARDLWRELDDAMAGNNGYGDDVAEIYAYRLVSDYNPRGGAPMSEAQSMEAGRNLTALLRRFREVHSDVIVLLEMPGGFVPLGEDGECPPFGHRVHVRVGVGPARCATDRDARQAQVIAWAKSVFGEAQATGLPQRGLRLLEEAVEAFQAAGGDKAQGHKLIDYVFARPVGDLGQELGGVGVCVMMLAAAAGLSAEAEERREVVRVLSRPAEEWAARNQAKNDAGFLAADAAATIPRSADEAATFDPQHWVPHGWARGCLTPSGVDWAAIPHLSSHDESRLITTLRAADIGTNHDATILGMVRELVRQRDLSRRQHGELVEAYAKLVVTPPATDADIGAGIKNNMLSNELARIRLAVNRAALPMQGADDIVSRVETVVDALRVERKSKEAALRAGTECFSCCKDAVGLAAVDVETFDQLAVIIAKQRDELAFARKRLRTAHRGLKEMWRAADDDVKDAVCEIYADVNLPLIERKR